MNLRTLTRLAFVAGGLFLWGASAPDGAAAAVPSTFTYQGSLLENGIPVTATKNMVFKIVNFDGSTCYWNCAETPVGVPVSKGHFSVALTPTGVDWPNVVPYVEVKVDGTVLLPREPMNAVPYAFVAGDVDNAISPNLDNTYNGVQTYTKRIIVSSSAQAVEFIGDGAKLSNLPAVYPGSSTVWSAPHVFQASVTFQSPALNFNGATVNTNGGGLFAIDGLLTVGQGGAVSTMTSSGQILAGQTVSAPQTITAAAGGNGVYLSSGGFVAFTGRGSQPGISAGRLYFDNNGDGALMVSLDGTTYSPLSTGTFAGANLWSEGSGNVYRLTGNIGIGTSAPTTLDSPFTIRRDNTNAAVVSALQNDAGGLSASAQWRAFLGGGAGTPIEAARLEAGKKGDFTTAADQRSYLALHTIGAGAVSERMRLDDVGQVGVGTGAPAARLHVSSAGAGGGDILLLVSTNPSAGSEVLSVSGSGQTRLVSALIGDGAVLSTVSAAGDIAAAGALSAVTSVSAGAGVVLSSGGFMDLSPTSEPAAATGRLYSGGASLFYHDGSRFVDLVAGAGSTWKQSNTLGPVEWSTSSVAIGHSTPTATFHISSSPQVTSMYLVKVTTGTAQSQTLLAVQASGGTGIGTDTPNSRLDVRGAQETLRVDSNDSDAAKLINFTQANSAKQVGYIGTSSGSLTLVATGGAGDLVLSPSGGVGVSTGFPQTLLDVNGSFSAGSGAAKSTITATGALQIGGAGNSYFNGGNVGVGTLTPARKLSVEGAVRLGISAVPGSPVVGDIFQDGANLYFYDGSSFVDLTAGAGGGVAIGDNPTWTGSHIWQGTTQMQNASFTVGGSTFVVSSGRVGVGTANPARDFHLQGIMRVANAIQPASPAVGDIYSNGLDLFFYNGSTWDDLTAGGSGVSAVDSPNWTGVHTFQSSVTVNNVIASTSGGIKYPDGNTQTVAYQVRAASMVYIGDQVVTSTAWTGISGSTITLTMTGGRAMAGFTCISTGSTSTTEFAVGLVVDGQLIDGQSEGVGLADGGVGRVVGQDATMSFTHLTEGVYSGSTSFTLVGRTTQTTQLNASDRQRCQFWVQEM